ncbi:MAG: hypothetical protein NC930_04325 [Candidatus Omnitrophica bacterium]|nr:hypothetical protein [Candidatus Omnitrophota bacterium]
MKQMDRRQNKIIQTKAQMKHYSSIPPPAPEPHAKTDEPEVRYGGVVYGLVTDLLVATKLAQMAKQNHLSVHNFDKADRLLETMKTRHPNFIAIDWDTCEAEAYKLLGEVRKDEKMKTIPVVGYVSSQKSAVRKEAEQAGCDRVYLKTEFMRNLADLFVRYAL